MQRVATGLELLAAVGLPDPEHFMSARDIARLAAVLIRQFPDYYAWYSEKEFTFNNIRQHNRNTLLWRDPAIDGLKTGHTEAAGYCLVASAVRDGTRLLSVIMGTESIAARTKESSKLLNYGFQFFDTVRLYENAAAVSRFRVWKGTAEEVSVGFLSDFVLSVPTGQADKLQVKLDSVQPLEAPVNVIPQFGALEIGTSSTALQALTDAVSEIVATLTRGRRPAALESPP